MMTGGSRVANEAAYATARFPIRCRLPRRAIDETQRRQMPAVRNQGPMDAGFEVAAVLFGALQADRSRRLGERALSRRNAGDARSG